MPNLQVTTKSATSVWKSPDGKIEMFDLTLDYQGKPVSAKTYSSAIATVGWSGEVETYEKPDKNGGSQTFVKQPPKEGFQNFGGSTRNGSAGSSGGSYAPRDDSHIKAQWAIGQAVSIVDKDLATPVFLSKVEDLAAEMFAMVDRVKEGTVAPVADAPDTSVVDAIFNEPLPLPPETETPWPGN